MNTRKLIPEKALALLGRMVEGARLLLPALAAMAFLLLSNAYAAAPATSLAITFGSSLVGPVPSQDIRAWASDSDGTVALVQFYDNGVLIGSGTLESGNAASGLYKLTWNNIAVGTHVLTAVATDNAAEQTTSASFTLTVTQNVPPAATMTAPTNGTSIPGPVSTYYLTATVSDSDGIIDHVHFYDGTTYITHGVIFGGTASNSPYRGVWTNVPVGTHVITAVVTDNSGGGTTSAPVTLTVTQNVLPSVSVTMTDTSLPGPVPTLQLRASAADTDGTISLLQFYDNGVLVGNGVLDSGNSTSGVYRRTWSNISVGTHVITAVATDSTGGQTTSASYTLTVTQNVLPTVSIILPTEANTTVVGPVAGFNLRASASDSDGTISTVNFYANSTLLGGTVLDGGSYRRTWYNVPVGVYVITAVATDSSGGSTTSAPIVLNVTDGTAAATGMYFVNADHLGTPRLIENQSQQAVWTWDNAEAFGDSQPNENPAGLGSFSHQPRFPGQYADKETGTNYNYYRDYSATDGKYKESDPIGLIGGLNTYAYVDAKPLQFQDPEGLCIPPILAAGCAWLGSNSWWLAPVVEAGALIATGTPSPTSSVASGTSSAATAARAAIAQNALFAGRAAQPAIYNVYLGYRNGMPVYVGITSNLVQRGRQWSGTYEIKKITSCEIPKDQARAIEQVLIDMFPGFDNQINSIAPYRSWFPQAKAWGTQWLQQNQPQLLIP